MLSHSSCMSPACPSHELKGMARSKRPTPISMPANSPRSYTLNEDFTSLEVLTTNVKQVLKLLKEHKNSPPEDDGCKLHHLAGILTILDEVRSSIELRSQSFVRRINSDHLRRLPAYFSGGNLSPRSPQPCKSSTGEENMKLRRELSASMTARKSLEKMFSSLGREKEMIAGELARKVQELHCIAELVEDLRAENNMLSEKIQICAAEHRRSSFPEDMIGVQERNRELSEQLIQGGGRGGVGEIAASEYRY